MCAERKKLLSTVFNFCSRFSSLRAAHGKWGPQADSWCSLDMQTLLPEPDSLGLKQPVLWVILKGRRFETPCTIPMPRRQCGSPELTLRWGGVSVGHL